MSPKFKILDKKNIHDGFFKMNEVTLKYKKYDGNWSNEIKRELFGGAQVSAVLPYDPINKKIVLIQQFRPGTISRDNQNYLDEIVAGIIDPGETPEDTAKRECLEETGCEISNLKSIQGYFPAPGSSPPRPGRVSCLIRSWRAPWPSARWPTSGSPRSCCARPP